MVNSIVTLDGVWRMQKASGGEWLSAQIPGSLYSNFLLLRKMGDPFFGENEREALELSKEGCLFERSFVVAQTMLSHEKLFLRFDGIDTLASITLNGQLLGTADNMHRAWEYDVTGLIQAGENVLRVQIASPLQFLETQQKAFPLWGVDSTVPGYAHLRKAHYMFGWDWGPKLPDLGIWRPVSLIGCDVARLDDVHIRQRHGADAVTLDITIEAKRFSEQHLRAEVTVTSPAGTKQCAAFALQGETGHAEIAIPDPALWWPNGYGEQPLYQVAVRLLSDGRILDEKTLRIGLRTVTVSREPDTWGQEFCFVVNGIKIFAMGGDYIPEDQILARVSPEKTRRLLEQCVACHFNHIRVWGGGYYPDDCFFDACDELGLLVWHDFMFACAVYRMQPAFVDNITQELVENIRRIRHHACLALWCGNNEMEDGLRSWNVPREEWMERDYLYQYETLFPAICAAHDPDTFYWPSSPSSGGGFESPNSPDCGDVHYWDVWHGLKPWTAFRKFYFRFCSEYGFMSVPSVKTVAAIADEADWNLFSPALENHDKCDDGSKKLLYYLSQMMPYPYTFEGVVYATQLLQADAIRANVEHMRRNRGRCMGSTYWQVNDSNPVISWSSIDYFGRWKALHYYARRFYAPLLLSVDESDVAALVFNVSSELRYPVTGTVRWTLRDANANILRTGCQPMTAAPLCAAPCFTLDLSLEIRTPADRRSRYLEYELQVDGAVVSAGSSLFAPPKHFVFADPAIAVKITEDAAKFTLVCSANAFAKSVYLELAQADCVFSDNWFDIHGAMPVAVTVPKSTLSEGLTLEQFRAQLRVMSCWDLLRRETLF